MRAVQLLRKLDPAEWGGTETAIQRLCDGLQAQGVTPIVYCPKLTRNEHNDPLAKSGCHVQRFKAFVPVLGLSRTRRQQLIAVGGNLMSFDLIGSLLLEQNFDVLHTHTLGRIGAIGRTIARRRKVPFLVSIHGGVLDLPPQVKREFNSPGHSGWEWGKLFGLLFQSHRLFQDADAILTCNEKEAALLRERHPHKKIIVQPHGVPVEVFQKDQRSRALQAFPQVRNHKLLVNVGRVDPIKNQRWLLEQIPNLIQTHPDLLVVLAGPCTDEPYGTSIQQLLQSKGLGQHVLLTGGLPPNDPRLIGLMQLAGATVLCSLSETFGLILLEAWAAGSSVIASSTSGAKALVRPGENGWLFDLDTPATFTQAVSEALSQPACCARMAAAGRDLVIREFSVLSLAGKMKSLYAELKAEKDQLCVT